MSLAEQHISRIISERSPEGPTAPSLLELYKTGYHSDLTVYCGRTRYNVHKAIVCPKSSFFRAACEQGRWKEGSTGVVRLLAEDEDVSGSNVADDPVAIDMMFQFIYTWGYLINPYIVEARSSDLALHAKVYALGEKYDVRYLQEEAQSKLLNEITANWDDDSVYEMLSVVSARGQSLWSSLRSHIVEALLQRDLEVSLTPAVMMQFCSDIELMRKVFEMARAPEFRGGHGRRRGR